VSAAELNRSAKDMISLWWKSIRWIATVGVMLWFVLLPLLPVYGLLRPWPAAQEKLKAEGITGFPLMIGAGGDGERRVDSSGEYWHKEKQRSYVVVPDSFRGLELFTYSESRGSGLAGVQSEITRSRWLIPLLALWILAGFFTARTLRQSLREKKPNRVAGSD
jgi:hypothetical protein